ncbi:MAG: ATP-grasp domain-containing protein [Bacteroidota bacterium]|nr:ATP-grasp domain-containing protein [Bacteroidota bacterium]
MNKPKYTIAVTGLNATDNPGPGVPVIRALKESRDFDTRIIGFAYESLEPGIFLEELVDKTYHIPYPSAGKDNIMRRLQQINSVENIDIFIPNFDAEMLSFIKLEPQLKEMGIHTFLPTIEQFEERHKTNLFEFGKKYGIKVPFSQNIFDECEILNFANNFNYPLVIKGKFYEAYIAYNYDEAKKYFHNISAKWGIPIIVQQFIQGDEYNVIAMGDGNGNMIAAVPMRKKIITEKGKAWAGITIEEDKLMKMTNKIINGSKWRGPLELELIKSSQNEFYLIEVNPRIPAWVYLAVGAGQNIPETIVKLALGVDIEPYDSYKVGKLFIRYSWDKIVDISEFEKIATMGES